MTSGTVWRAVLIGVVLFIAYRLALPAPTKAGVVGHGLPLIARAEAMDARRSVITVFR